MNFDFSPYLAPLLVVVGWAVVNQQHNKRESRKEARTLVDSTKKAVVELAKMAVAYQVQANADLAHDIKAGLEALEIELERTPHFAKWSPLMERYIAFADAATGGDFETTERKQRTLTAPEVAEVQRTRNALLAELERQFRGEYL